MISENIAVHCSFSFAKKYGVDFAVVRDREKSPPVYTVFFKAKDTDAVPRILQDYSVKQIKKPSLEAKRRMMDLDNLIKGLYENFTLGDCQRDSLTAL